MDAAFEKRVRERAYEIWLAAGMNDGAADSHWLSAEQAVKMETAKPGAKAKAVKKAVSVKAAAPVAATGPVRKSTKSKVAVASGASICG